MYERIISGAVYLAFHPVRQMEWLIIWKLSKSLAKCDSVYVQKNPTIWCSLFGSPSSKADEVAQDMESNMELLTKCDNPCVQKNHKWCSLFGFPSSKADGVVCVPSETAFPNKQTLDELENDDVLHSSQRFPN